jgi:hypothetical protein
VAASKDDDNDNDDDDDDYLKDNSDEKSADLWTGVI